MAKTLRGTITAAQVKASIDAYESLKNTLGGINNEQEKLAALQEAYADKQRLINELSANFRNLTDEQKRYLESLITTQAQELTELREKSKLLKDHNKYVQEEIKQRKNALAVLGFFNDQLKAGWKYLQESDKIIKQTILGLGMSGSKAKEMRISFEQSVGVVSMLGASLEDISKIQMGFADETGRARTMSAQMLEDITAMGKGTGLGIENATKLAAQFEYMGVDVKNTMKYVQGVVDTSERMGINTTKVLKNVTDNFKRLGTFSFKNGVKAFADMAMNAEKTRVNMKTALDVADATKGLDQVIELMANLQVMGGKFAELDPFQALYMSRNEPEKWVDKISEMTTGMYTLKKNSKGIFEEFISPADADRLANVAKSLGISKEEMFEIAKRRLALNTLNKDLSGMGLTGAQKELIQGAAILNQETGKYEVTLAGKMRDIRDLTKDQLSAFEQEQKTLKDRAKEAQTFDEAFKNTVNALKGALLPLLRGVNYVLEKVRPIFDALGSLAGKGGWGIVTAAGLLVAGAGAIKLAAFMLSKASSNWVETGSMRSGRAGGARGLRGFLQRGGGTTTTTVPPTTTTPAGGGASNPNAGKGLMRGGAGIGAAALGIGAGIGLAAVGISKLADSMAKLDKTQIWALPVTVLALAAAFAVFTPAIIAVGTAGTVSAVGLLALGGAALGIGAGIGIAAAGIGYMAQGLALLVDKGKDSGWTLLQIGAGIAAINLAMATTGSVGAVGGFLGGFKSLSKTLEIISANADGIAKAGNGFKNLTATLSGNADDFIAIKEAVEAISKVNVRGGGILADLANLLKSPLKVEFADKKVSLYNDITLNIDGQRFMNKTYDINVAIQKYDEAKNGKAGKK